MGISKKGNLYTYTHHPLSWTHSQSACTYIKILFFLPDRFEIVKVLHRAGSELNALDCHGFTPLHTAVHLDRMRIVHEILKWDGVNVNAKNFDGATPLHTAAMRGNLVFVIN